jgi:ABC transporter, ATP-binding protein
MFWNLVRYEFKNVNKWYLALYGAVLAISVLISMSITSISHTYNSYSNNSPYLLVLLLLAFGGLSVTLWIATIFLIIRRFKGSVYDRQGYLTLTLPVSEHQIISAKLLGGLIWSILSYIVFILSVLIIFSLTPVVKEIPTLYRLMSPYLGYGWLYGLSLLTGSVTWILSIYLSISIGQLFNEYRTALAVLAYIVISIVVSYIGFFLKVDDQINTLMIVGILKNILLGTIYYLGTYYILKNKVNLQ